MRGGHEWETVLPTASSAKAAAIVDQLKRRDVHTSVPECDTLAWVAATAIIVHAWRARLVGHNLPDRNLRVLAARIGAKAATTTSDEPPLDKGGVRPTQGASAVQLL